MNKPITAKYIGSHAEGGIFGSLEVLYRTRTGRFFIYRQHDDVSKRIFVTPEEAKAWVERNLPAGKADHWFHGIH